jgi:hypothetical protein
MLATICVRLLEPQRLRLLDDDLQRALLPAYLPDRWPIVDGKGRVVGAVDKPDTPGTALRLRWRARLGARLVGDGGRLGGIIRCNLHTALSDFPVGNMDRNPGKSEDHSDCETRHHCRRRIGLAPIENQPSRRP